MPLPSLAKLALKPEQKVFTINPPKDADAQTNNAAKKIDLADVAVLYAIKESQLPKYADTVKALPPEGLLWICYPKIGKLETDLGRDKIWQWMVNNGFQAEKVVSIDDTWAALSFKR